MQDPSPTDTELLAEWLRHHREDSFHQLVTRYAGLVHAAARRTSNDDTLAAEASQLVFILLARKAKYLTSRGSLAGWLHLTTVMQTKNLLRTSRRETRKRALLQAAMENEPPHHPQDSWQEMQPVLDDALAALSEKDREALLLRFYRSLTIREIATTLGIATDAAQKRIDRATERLRGKLARRGCQTGGSLGAAMMAGFATDAQAVGFPVSLLATQAMSAGAAGSGVFPGIISIFKADTMISTSIIAPLSVLLSAGALLAWQRHSIATLEQESALLEKYLAVHPSDSVSLVESAVRTKPDQSGRSIRWRDVALQLVEMRRNDETGYSEIWQQYQQRVLAMNEGDLTTALDEIETPDMPAEGRELLEQMFIETITHKIPEVTLARFRDRLKGPSSGIGWELANAIAVWAKKNPAEAVAWFDREVAAGTFEGKSLSGENQILLKFHGFLLAVLMSSDPEGAVRRVAAIPEKQRAEVLSVYKFGAVPEGEQLAYANLVRGSLLPEGERASLLAHRIENLPADKDFSSVTRYLESIRATPVERSTCVERAAQTRIGKLGEIRKITRQDLDQLREWTTTQAPGITDRVTGNALGNAMGTSNPMTFSEAAALAAEYQKTSGNDELLLRFLDRWNGPGSADEARELAEKIVDETNRNNMLKRIGILKNIR